MNKLSLWPLLLLLLPPLLPGGGQEDVIKEKVEVVNIEVPVRVFFKGKTVAGLTRNDFVLLEDKVPQQINGFYMRKKRIQAENVAMKSGERLTPESSRYIVLVFRILDYNEQLQKGVQYIFSHMLRDNDQLLVFVNDRTLFLDRNVWQVQRQQILDQVLREESTSAMQKLEAFFLKISKDLDQTKLQLLTQDDANFYAPAITAFLRRYLDTWKEFKKKYLIPDLDKFYNFSQHLEKVRGEKWVLTFYQIEMFPNLKITSMVRQDIENLLGRLISGRSEDVVHARIISRLMDDITRELNVAADFPSEEISKLLIKVDTTYHALIMGVQRESVAEDFEFKKVASDVENSLREVTAKSGGEVIFAGDMGSALHTIESRDDIYYVLTYVPKDPAKKGKIRVRCQDPRYQLFYDDNIREDYIREYLEKRKQEDPTVQLAQLTFDQKKLVSAVEDFRLEETERGRQGRLQVIVEIRDSQDQKIFQQSRLITAKQPLVTIAIDFPWLESGRYLFMVQVADLNSGKIAMDFLHAEVR